MLFILANHMEDLFGKEEMVDLTEMGGKGKVAWEKATVAEVEKTNRAGIK